MIQTFFQQILEGAKSVTSQGISLFGLESIVDIIVVAFIIYVLILLFKRTHSTFIFFGVAIFGIIYAIAYTFNLYLTRSLFQTIFPFFIFILVVIFQREIRYFFEWMATWRLLSFLKPKQITTEPILNIITAALTKFAETRTGALIVFSGRQSIDQFLTGGTVLAGRVSFPLLLSIFDDSSPGHDGAVVMKGNLIEKFGCRLPLSEKFKSEIMGTRHCAAVGLSERCDAFVIVVSEERGIISYAYKGVLTSVANGMELKNALQNFLSDQIQDPTRQTKWHSFFSKNAPLKASALVLATILWFGFSIVGNTETINRQFTVPIEYRSVPQGYVVEGPTTANVTLAGKNPDFKTLNKMDLALVIDIEDSTAGNKKISITEDALKVPAKLEIVSFSPHTLRYSIRKQEGL